MLNATPTKVTRTGASGGAAVAVEADHRVGAVAAEVEVPAGHELGEVVAGQAREAIDQTAEVKHVAFASVRA